MSARAWAACARIPLATSEISSDLLPNVTSLSAATVSVRSRAMACECSRLSRPARTARRETQR